MSVGQRGTLVIRTDSSTEIGSGHAMRCLALAQAWKDKGGRVLFLMAGEAPIVWDRLISEGMEVTLLSVNPGQARDGELTVARALDSEVAWVVVDGYHFGHDYQQAIKDAGLRLLFIDDNGEAQRYCADLVLNQNLFAEESMYSHRDPATRLLLGGRYVLLRREFLTWHKTQLPVSRSARRVLVTLGGGDPNNVTLKVMKSLLHAKIKDLEVVAVLGGSNPHQDTLKRAVSDFPFSATLQGNVTDMTGLMAWADLAVCAGGTTCWELAFMGLPAIVLILADNQVAVAEAIAKQGAARTLGWHNAVTEDDIGRAITHVLSRPYERKKMSLTGPKLIDGLGAKRVMLAMEREPLKLRPARDEDCEVLWRWANDEAVRAASLHSGQISWNEHARWVSRKQHDPHCFHFIAMNGVPRPVGQIRFEVDGLEAEIHLSVGKEDRGKGVGSMLIEQGVEELLKRAAIKRLHAFVRPENKPSAAAFRNAGFQKVGEKLKCGILCEHFVWTVGKS